MVRIIKQKKISKASTADKFLSIDLHDSENLLPTEKIYVEYGLKNCTVNTSCYLKQGCHWKTLLEKPDVI